MNFSGVDWSLLSTHLSYPLKIGKLDLTHSDVESLKIGSKLSTNMLNYSINHICKKKYSSMKCAHLRIWPELCLWLSRLAKCHPFFRTRLAMSSLFIPASRSPNIRPRVNASNRAYDITTNINGWWHVLPFFA